VIIVGVDPLRCDPEPLALASMLGRLTGAPVTAVSAHPHDPVDPANADLARVLRDEALAALGRCARELPEGTTLRAVASESPARALHEIAESMEADLLVLGPTYGGPLGRLALGNVADRVLHGAPCPVAIAPRGYEAPAGGPGVVCAAFVDTPEGRDALDGAAALAARAGASLQALTIVEWFDPTGMVAPPAQLIEHEREQTVELARQAAHHALERLSVDVEAEAVVLPGGTAATLVERSAGLDLLVCGSRGYGPVRTVLLGSVSHALAHHARCPLIVLPRGTDRTLERLVGH